MNPILPKARGLVLAAALLGTVAPGAATHADTLLVPTDYATIQAAIDDAAPLDVVMIEPGTYSENITLADGVAVRGREAARTILEPDNAQLPTVEIRGVNNLRLSNLTIVDSSVAVEVAASEGIAISNVIFVGASDAAIESDLTSVVFVVNNVFFDNDVAIRRNALTVDVANNIFSDNVETLTSPNLVNNNANVLVNCWWNNDDLVAGAGYGTVPIVGDPLFVDPGALDFHLRQGSPCIDVAAASMDVIDNTIADAGAYGGQFADVRPYPVPAPTLTDASTASPAVVNVDVSWEPNLAYHVTNTAVPGSYRVYYRRNAAGPPYDGTDAGGGTAPSPIEVDADTTALTLANLSPSAPAATATVLREAEGLNASVTLRWDAIPGVERYRIRYGVDSTGESVVDTGNVTTFTVTGLVNGTTYRFAVAGLTQAVYHVAVTAVDNTQAAHESVLSPDVEIAIGEVGEGPLSNELTAIPELLVAYPLLPDDDRCFIATAAYGADWAAEVRTLRAFRDRYLLPNAAGRWLVEQYYRFSPPVADWLRGKETMRMLVRWLLTPLVALATFLLETTAATKLAGGALLLSLGVVAARRRRAAARGQDRSAARSRDWSARS